VALGIVLIANLVGAIVIVAVISQVGPRLGVIEIDVLGEIASRLLQYEWRIMLLSAMRRDG
jgi:hypothetical protein